MWRISRRIRFFLVILANLRKQGIDDGKVIAFKEIKAIMKKCSISILMCVENEHTMVKRPESADRLVSRQAGGGDYNLKGE